MLLAVVRNDVNPVKLANKLWEKGLSHAKIWSGDDEESITTRDRIALAFGAPQNVGRSTLLANKQGVASYGSRAQWANTSERDSIFVLPVEEVSSFVSQYCARQLDLLTVNLDHYPGIVLDLDRKIVIDFL